VIDERLELCLAFARDDDLRSQLRADVAQRGVDVAAGRVHFRRDLVFDQRLVELAGRFEPAGTRHVILRGAELDALQHQQQCPVVGVSLERRGVFGDRPVVVLRLFGALSGAKGAGGGACRKGDRQRQGGRQAFSYVCHQ